MCVCVCARMCVRLPGVGVRARAYACVGARLSEARACSNTVRSSPCHLTWRAVVSSPLQILVIGLIARGTRRLSCSMRGSLRRVIADAHSGQGVNIDLDLAPEIDYAACAWGFVSSQSFVCPVFLQSCSANFVSQRHGRHHGHICASLRSAENVGAHSHYGCTEHSNTIGCPCPGWRDRGHLRRSQ